MQYSKVILTGAAGFIGSHLAKRLLETGVEVVGIDNINDYYDVSLKYHRLSLLEKYENFTFIRCDISNKDELTGIFEEHKADVVINLAAQAGVRYSIENPQVYIDSNVIGFFNILEACRNNPVKHLVYASSSSVYGNSDKIPFSVDDRVDNPISLYAATKKSNELMAYTYSHLFGIPATGLRFFTVYGPAGRPDMAYFSFTKKILAGEPIKLFNYGELERDFTYVDDIVEGIMNIIPTVPEEKNGARAKVYNIGNNKPVALKEFVAALEEAIGVKAKIEYLPMQPGDVYRTYADISELEKDFGFRPQTDIRTGLKKFAEWYKDYYKEV
ncbi:MAG: NAD-dependent epimerase [Clostridia bacterium]|nr:NAD-dependent epimerase [Clostridia bacterium]MBR6635533.1 NAD-dependent epimerase [Clostridia bacterium]